MTRHLAAVLVLVPVVGLVAGAQARPAATASIEGTVVDATTGAPIAEASVRLGDYSPLFSAPWAGRTETDPSGNFSFVELPAGRYAMPTAMRVGYLSGHYGDTGADVARAPAAPLDLASGAHLRGLTIRLWKAAEISGMVTDDHETPLRGVTVRALRWSIAAGARRLTSSGARSTDDQGQYRIPDLVSGRYVVQVLLRRFTAPASTAASPGVSQTLRDSAIFGGMPMGALGNLTAMAKLPPTAVDGGRLFLDAPLPPDPGDGQLWTYPTGYYLNGSTALEAMTIVVGPGDQRSLDSIRLRPVPTHRVTGHVVGTDAISGLAVRLAPLECDRFAIQTDDDAAAGVIDRDGRFTLAGVVPGAYQLRVLAFGGVLDAGSFTSSVFFTSAEGSRTLARSQPDQPFAALRPSPDPTWWSDVPVTVGNEDVNVVVGLQRGFRVSGMVSYDGGSPRPDSAALLQMSVLLEPANGNAPFPSFVGGRVEADGHFASGEMPPGTYLLTVPAPPRWSLEAVRVGNQDVSTRPMQLDRDITDATIVLTDRATSLSGTVHGADRNPDPTASVVVFPIDRTLWVDTGSHPRALRASRVTATGQYSFDGLPAGEYDVAALAHDNLDDWRDPDFLTSLAALATSVTLKAGGRIVQDLTVAHPSRRSIG